MHRANSLCDDKFITNEFSHIDKALKQNGYPQKMISNISRKLLQNETATNTGPNNSKYISAPYIHGTSERVARVLIKHNINLAHKPIRTLKNELCHVKDKRTVENKAGVVYKLGCNDCDAVYVGETGRQVKDRMREHQNDIVKAKSVSKVFNHVDQTGHSFDFDNVKVLDLASHVKTRLHLESIHTKLQPNSINRSLTLNSAYDSILHSTQH